MSLPIIYILIPSLHPTGPVKGAIALCNGLIAHMPVSLIYLKQGPSAAVGLDSRVNLLDMTKITNWRNKIQQIRKMYGKAGGRNTVSSISFCFSADMVNYFLYGKALRISNPRGNLFKNYRFDYGISGFGLAWFHYSLLKRFEVVVAISKTMADQLRNLGFRHFHIIGNFLDEDQLELYRRNTNKPGDQIRFVYLASLSDRKRPDLAIDSLHKLIKEGFDWNLDVIGDGPKQGTLTRMVEHLDIGRNVTFHGHLSAPYNLLQKADLMLLPSESEGISRAVMEALFFGVPCIVRDVDANKEIITEGVNGFLFKSDNDLASVMKKAALSIKSNVPEGRTNLLPPTFQKSNSIEKYIALINANL